MRAVAVRPAEQKIDLVDLPDPELERPDQVVLRTLEVGVCGTDKEIARFQYGTPPPRDDILVIGHEALAEVVEVGAEVEGWQPGDLAVPTVRRPCERPECRACRSGRQDYCFTGEYTERGIKQAHGYMAQLFVEEARYLNQVPADLRSCGVLVEPLTIAEKALREVHLIQQRLPWIEPGAPLDSFGQGHRAVVLGAGPVALLGLMALLRAGFETWVYSRSPAPNVKADVAQALGATYISSSEHSVDELADAVGNIDLVYEAVGASSVAFDVLGALGTNGIFAFTGVPGRKPPSEVDTEGIMRNLVLKNQVAFGTVNAGSDAFAAAIGDLAIFKQRWPREVDAIISARHPMEEHGELLLGSPGGIKHVVRVEDARAATSDRT